MTKPRVPQNLPPDSQQWVRDIERRLNDLETQNQRLTRSVTQNVGQIHDIQEGVRSARGGTQSVSVVRNPMVVGSGSEQVRAEIAVPQWAESVTVVATGFIDMRNTLSSAGLSVRVVLSDGTNVRVITTPDEGAIISPRVRAETTMAFPTPDSTNSVTLTATATILPGETHLVLQGGYNWDIAAPLQSGIFYQWGLTAFWSANPYNEDE